MIQMITVVLSFNLASAHQIGDVLMTDNVPQCKELKQSQRQQEVFYYLHAVSFLNSLLKISETGNQQCWFQKFATLRKLLTGCSSVGKLYKWLQGQLASQPGSQRRSQTTQTTAANTAKAKMQMKARPTTERYSYCCHSVITLFFD